MVEWTGLYGRGMQHQQTRRDGVVEALETDFRGNLMIDMSYYSKFGKLSSGHSTGKGQFSFQSQRKAMPKNAQTTAQLHSSHTLVK